MWLFKMKHKIISWNKYLNLLFKTNKVRKNSGRSLVEKKVKVRTTGAENDFLY